MIDYGPPPPVQQRSPVYVFPSGRHAAMAVDVRSVVQNAGRLVREKVRKECPCEASDSARCKTWRSEDEVF